MTELMGKEKKQSSSVVVLKILPPLPVKKTDRNLKGPLIFPRDCSHDWISIPCPVCLLVHRVRQEKPDIVQASHSQIFLKRQ